MAKSPSDDLPAPRPWASEMSQTVSGNYDSHLYLVDANGRKIAAIWGRANEKHATAELILKAVNGEGSNG